VNSARTYERLLLRRAGFLAAFFVVFDDLAVVLALAVAGAGVDGTTTVLRTTPDARDHGVSGANSSAYRLKPRIAPMIGPKM